MCLCPNRAIDGATTFQWLIADDCKVNTNITAPNISHNANPPLRPKKMLCVQPREPPLCLCHHASAILPVPLVEANIALNLDHYNLGHSLAIAPAEP